MPLERRACLRESFSPPATTILSVETFSALIRFRYISRNVGVAHIMVQPYCSTIFPTAAASSGFGIRIRAAPLWIPAQSMKFPNA